MPESRVESSGVIGAPLIGRLLVRLEMDGRPGPGWLICGGGADDGEAIVLAVTDARLLCAVMCCGGRGCLSGPVAGSPAIAIENGWNQGSSTR